MEKSTENCLSLQLDGCDRPCNVYLVNVEGVKRNAEGVTEALLVYSKTNDPAEPTPNELAVCIGTKDKPKWVEVSRKYSALVVSLYEDRKPFLAHIAQCMPISTLDVIIKLDVQ